MSFNQEAFQSAGPGYHPTRRHVGGTGVRRRDCAKDDFAQGDRFALRRGGTTDFTAEGAGKSAVADSTRAAANGKLPKTANYSA